MKNSRFAIVFCVLALLLAVGFAAKADQFNKLTYITFSQPVELPGNVILQPGTYAFTVVRDFPDRHVVQVFDKDRTHLYATVLAIPNYRVKATDKTVVKFSETAAGAPNAVKEWFYPGNANGQEFVYPKKRAEELAQASNEPVPSMPEEVSAEVTQPATQELEKAPLKVEEPSGAEVEVAEAYPTTPPTAHRLTALPKTASDLPLIGLMGFLLMSVGAGLWAFSKRSA
jgi:LPXTG-motif cell wall-anchored protein